jgi:hypothetical protein
VLYAWLYRAGESVWPVVVVHWMHNLVSGNLIGRMLGPQDNLILAAFIAGFYAVLALILILALGPSLGQREGVRQLAA